MSSVIVHARGCGSKLQDERCSFLPIDF
eukprot:COSAG02_NODE_52413_length_308_cov_0.602871_1_plen_27_part_10